MRSDVVGSLLRPDSLKTAFARFEAGDLDADGLRQVEDAAIGEVIQRQEALGLPVVTDGEFRRLNFQDSFGASVAGFGSAAGSLSFHEQRVAGAAPGQRWDPGYAGGGPPVVHRRPTIERLRLVRNLPVEEFLFASRLATRTVKVTLIGPDRITQRFAHESSRAVYPDVDAFMADLVAVQREMVRGLVDAGCRYIQIDEPGYTAYVDQPSLEQMRARGEDPAQNLERSLRAEQAIIADFPDVTFGVHICRGNQRSMWHREGTYDAIAEQLFSSLPHQRLLLEYDTERAGSFAPLRFVPPEKTVVLGLVSTKTPELESPDLLKRRIEEAARYVPLDRLALSPQCGFASDIVGNLLSEADQWRKLALVQQVSAEVFR